MRQSFSFGHLAIGVDNRPSSVAMAAACAGIAQALGIKVSYYGVLPTPALAYKAMQDRVPAIMVTGSHIPFDRNGLKFYRPDGEISKADEVAILAVDSVLLSFETKLLTVDRSAEASYIKRYTSVFAKNCLAGKHIGIYEHSSAGRDIYQQVFEALGAKVTPLERTDTFVPIDTEAVSEADKQKAVAWSARYKFDAIFSTDGDGDRPLIADEYGNWLRGDIVGLLTARTLNIKALAVPVSCNTAIEQCGTFVEVVRTKIGSPYVIEAFPALLENSQAVAGFEANGGFLLGSQILLNDNILHALPTRDALLPALALLTEGSRLSQLVLALPQRFTASDRVQQVPATLSKVFLKNIAMQPEFATRLLGFSEREIALINQTDGIRISFTDGDIVHLRASGNAPELRVYAESCDLNGSNELVHSTIEAIQNYFSI